MADAQILTIGITVLTILVLRNKRCRSLNLST